MAFSLRAPARLPTVRVVGVVIVEEKERGKIKLHTLARGEKEKERTKNFLFCFLALAFFFLFSRSRSLKNKGRGGSRNQRCRAFRNVSSSQTSGLDRCKSPCTRMRDHQLRLCIEKCRVCQFATFAVGRRCRRSTTTRLFLWSSIAHSFFPFF